MGPHSLNKLPVTMGIRARAQEPKIITMFLTKSAQFLKKAVHPNQKELVVQTDGHPTCILLTQMHLFTFAKLFGFF